MPIVRKFDTDHIFQFGALDTEKGYAWNSFYRNSKSFEIHVRKESIEGTVFEQAWCKVLAAHDADSGNWVSQLENLDDVMIAQILPTLQTLAPNGSRQWTTVEDFLQTPSYRLEMVMDPATGDAAAKIVDGPQAKPAYSMRTYPLSQLELPPGMRNVDASEVVMLKDEENYLFPTKAVDPDTGTHCYFERTMKPTRSPETKQVSYRSLDTIARILRGDSRNEEGDSIAPLAIVTTTTGSPEGAEDGQDFPAVPTIMVAGLLHTLGSLHRENDLNGLCRVGYTSSPLSLSWTPLAAEMVRIPDMLANVTRNFKTVRWRR